MKIDFSKINTIQLIIILGLIILFIPPLIIKTSFIDFFNLGATTNEIGDTLGGITSPFINAIAAILVFIAFKEQVKANNLIKEQQYFQHIQEQINRLEDNFISLSEIIEEIQKNIFGSVNIYNTQIGQTKPLTIHVNEEAISKAYYITVLFQQTCDLIDQLEHNKDFMYKKIRILYIIMYKDNFTNLENKLKGVINQSSSETYIFELLVQIDILQKKFSN